MASITKEILFDALQRGAEQIAFSAKEKAVCRSHCIASVHCQRRCVENLKPLLCSSVVVEALIEQVTEIKGQKEKALK